MRPIKQPLRWGVVCLLLLTSCSVKVASIAIQDQQYVVSSSLVANTDIEGFINPYRDDLAQKVDQVLATSEAELTVGRQAKDFVPSQVALGNFMTDVMLSIGREKAKELNKPIPDVAITVWGSIRKSLPKGEITLRNIYELMPFENELVALKLSGKQLISLLMPLSRNYNPIAGIKMKREDSSSIWLGGNKPIVEDSYYYVLAADYHAFGNDNMAVLSEASDQYLCGIKVRDAIVLHLQRLTEAHQTLTPDYEPRITN